LIHIFGKIKALYYNNLWLDNYSIGRKFHCSVPPTFLLHCKGHDNGMHRSKATLCLLRNHYWLSYLFTPTTGSLEDKHNKPHRNYLNYLHSQ